MLTLNDITYRLGERLLLDKASASLADRLARRARRP
jgi:hypothetical protein